MAGRKVWHVVPHEGGWAVKKEEALRATSINKNKEQAVQAARELAKANKPSQIIIHGRDGRIQEERTYGEDPEKYPG